MPETSTDQPQEASESSSAVRREIVVIEHTFYRQGLPSFVAPQRALRSAASRALPLLASIVVLEHIWFGSAGWAIVWRVVLASGAAVVVHGAVRRFCSRHMSDRIPRPADSLWLLAFICAAPAMGYSFGFSHSEVLTFLAVQTLVAVLILVGVLGGVVGAILEAVEDLAGGLAQSLPALLRSLPLLTLFSLVIFLTSETWQVVGRMSAAHLVVVATLFGVLGALFLLSRLPGKVRDIERLGNSEGPPLEPSQRRNVAVVVAVQVVLQVVCVVALMMLLFMVLGAFAIGDDIYRQWEVDPGPAWRPSLFAPPTVLSTALVKVSGVLAVVLRSQLLGLHSHRPGLPLGPLGSSEQRPDGDVPTPTAVPFSARGPRLSDPIPCMRERHRIDRGGANGSYGKSRQAHEVPEPARRRPCPFPHRPLPPRGRGRRVQSSGRCDDVAALVGRGAPRLHGRPRQRSFGHVHLAAAHPGRFGHFASLPLPDVEADRREATRALDALGSDGVTIDNNAHGRYLGDDDSSPPASWPQSTRRLVRRAASGRSRSMTLGAHIPARAPWPVRPGPPGDRGQRGVRHPTSFPHHAQVPITASAIYPATPSQGTGSAPPLPLHDASRLRAAAHHARRIYPEPLGELVARELTAYAEFGHRFGDGLIQRVAAIVLATPVDGTGQEIVYEGDDILLAAGEAEGCEDDLGWPGLFQGDDDVGGLAVGGEQG